MDGRFLKITYSLGAKKINTYIKMPSPTYHVLKKEIEFCLFEERKQPSCEIRTFWIDDDKDEIEIINQCDYDIFMAKRSDRHHLQVVPIGLAAEEQIATSNDASNQTKIPPAAGSYDYAVHDQVECDACLMAPIIGFRYKCIQCANYDLCENCESKHIHPEHMMVRMPTKNCPNVVESYITGRNSGRRHGKRSKASCPFVKSGISVVIDDDSEAQNTSGGRNNEQSSPENGKERHYGRRHHNRHRNNFFSHLYEMMNDLAEGGGGAAAAHAMGEASTSSKTTTSSNGTQTTTTTTTNSNCNGSKNMENPIAAAVAANIAHETAKAAEIAAKVAHESAMKAAKNIVENMATSTYTTTSSSAGEKEKHAKKNEDGEKDKVDATSSPSDAQAQPVTVSVLPSPSLESIAHFLDPQFVKTGVQILNNFSDMFAKMLDPMENSENSNNQMYPDLSRNSRASSNASYLNSLGSDKNSKEEKITEGKQEEENKLTESDCSSSHVEIDDIGTDSENESGSGSFIKLYAPKNGNVSTPQSTKSTTASSAQATPPPSLDKNTDAIEFFQLAANLKSHIAKENNDSLKNAETNTESVENTKEAYDLETHSTQGTKNDSIKTVKSNTDKTNEAKATENASNPVITTNNTTASPTNLNANRATMTEEKRAVAVYHANQRINNAVHAMMSMGFSNEGAWLTQLLESVDGDIPKALDIMSAAQRNESR